MPRWSQAEFDAYQARRSRLCSSHQEPAQRNTLERPAPRESKSRDGAVERYHVRFTIYSVRPADWDGYHIKELQDLLFRSGFLPEDSWDVLRGEVISEKVHSKKEERTEIEIWLDEVDV